MKTRAFELHLFCYADLGSPEDGALIHQFGLFELDTAAAELRRDGRMLPLQEQPLAVLTALLESPGEIVDRAELRRRLWPKDVHVDFDNGINGAIARVREAVGDTASNPRFVVTVPRRGYRFIAPVSSFEPPAVDEGTVDDGTADDVAVKPAKRPGRIADWSTGKIVAVIAAVLTVGGLLTWIVASGIREESPTPVPKQKASLLGAEPIVKLAVLPLVNLGADAGREFLGDALTEELIALLGRLQPERLRVIARTSVMTYKGKDVSVQEIGRDLGVGFVLEGSVRQEGDAVRVTTALVEVAGQTRLWSATFDRTLVSLLSLEREIAMEVADALALKLLGPAVKPLAEGRSHELYLEGSYFLSQLTEEGFHKAIRAFEAALSEEPRSAAAQAGKAESWLLLGIFDFVDRQVAYEQGLDAATRALALDASSAEGHLALALTRYFYEWDFVAADAAFARALRLNPSLARAHLLHADLQVAIGRPDDAVVGVNRALALDPLSPLVGADACWLLFLAGREDEAIARCHRTLELDESFLMSWDVLKWIQIHLGNEEEAIAAYLRVVELEELHADVVPGLREVAAREGIEGLLRDALGATEARLKESGQSPFNLVLDYAALGRREDAFFWLERAFEERETDLVHLAVDPRLDLLRQDARMVALLDRIGLNTPSSP